MLRVRKWIQRSCGRDAKHRLELLIPSQLRDGSNSPYTNDLALRFSQNACMSQYVVSHQSFSRTAGCTSRLCISCRTGFSRYNGLCTAHRSEFKTVPSELISCIEPIIWSNQMHELAHPLLILSLAVLGLCSVAAIEAFLAPVANAIWPSPPVWLLLAGDIERQPPLGSCGPMDGRAWLPSRAVSAGPEGVEDRPSAGRGVLQATQLQMHEQEITQASRGLSSSPACVGYRTCSQCKASGQACQLS